MTTLSAESKAKLIGARIKINFDKIRNEKNDQAGMTMKKMSDEMNGLIQTLTNPSNPKNITFYE